MDHQWKKGQFFDIMAAMCKNRGIGCKGELPWPKLRKEYKYYTTVSSKPFTMGKKVGCIRGRVTWECTSERTRKRKNVINVVLTKHPESVQLCTDLHFVSSSFDDALRFCFSSSEIDRVWVFGGQDIYKLAVLHPLCRRIYLTHIQKDFAADRFFPQFGNDFKEIRSDEVEEDVMEENGLCFQIKIYEKSTAKFD